MKLKFSLLLLVFSFSLSNAQLVYWEKVFNHTHTITDIDVASNGYIFVCGLGVFRSTNNGNTWSWNGNANGGDYQLAIDSNDNIYAAQAGSWWGMYKSTDYGNAWIICDSEYVAARSMLTSTEGYIYVGDASGDFIKSTDNGNTWSKISVTDKEISGIVTLSDGQIFISTLGSSLFTSTDHGESWTQIVSTNLYNSIYSFETDSNDNLYAGHWDKIAKSTDRGMTWELIGNFSITSESVLSVDDSNNIYYAHHGVYKSTDSGNSWSYLGGPSYIRAICSINNKIFLGTSDGIYRYDQDRPIYVGSNYLPLHIGNKWQFRGKDYAGYWLTTHVVSADTLIGNIKYYKFLDNWVRYSEDDKKIYAWYNDTDCVHMDLTLIPQNNFVQYPLPYHSYSLFNIPNRIATFLHGNTTLFNMPLNYKGSGFDTTFIGATDYEENRYAENIGPYYYKFSNINLIRDHTIIMAIIYDSLGNQINYTNHYKPEISIIPITIINTESFDLTVLVEHSYSVITKNFIFVDSVYMQSYYQNNDSIIYNQNEIAIRISNSLNYRINTTLDTSLLKKGFDFYYRIVAKDKGIIPETSYSPDSSYYKCVWDFGTGLDFEQQLTVCDLFQNYPNPFNPITKIRFQLPKLSNVTLKIYDVLGREVSTLLNDEKTAGVYEVDFDASGFASGVYYYQLKSEEFIKTRKMQVMK